MLLGLHIQTKDLLLINETEYFHDENIFFAAEVEAGTWQFPSRAPPSQLHKKLKPVTWLKFAFYPDVLNENGVRK